MLPKNIKLKLNKYPWATEVFDADTCEQLTNIKRVDLVSLDANNQIFEARLVVDVIEVEGEITTAAIVPLTLSDAELDDLARRVERQMASRLERLTGLRQRRVEREQTNI